MTAPSSPSSSLTVRVLSGVADLPPTTGEAVVGDALPFLEWAWLNALETTGCATAEEGWLPQHLTLWRGEQLIALAPAYVKGHSQGEFVFDWNWAEVAGRLGVDYYPKLVITVPFTPATGSRFAVAPGEPRGPAVVALASAARAVAEKYGMSSVHALFCDPGDLELLAPLGFVGRHDLQYHWQNPGYASFDDFLARMSSKRRNTIKRERAQLGKDGVSIETVTGAALRAPGLADLAFTLYKSQVDKFHWGQQYLTRELFARAFANFGDRLDFVIARRAGRPIAGAINARKGQRIYGRYWGELESLPFLHFNVCYYHTIERAIAAGITTFEPGSGGLGHKTPRGFEPTLTHSAHWLREPRFHRIISDHLARERAHVRDERERLLAGSPLRKPPVLGEPGSDSDPDPEA